jgi:hypothetical protein
MRTSFEEMQVAEILPGKLPKNFDRNATHFVAGIEYGAESFFVLTEPKVDGKRNKSLAIPLSARVEELLGSLRGDSTLHTQHYRMRAEDAAVKCQYFGDISFPNALNNMNDCLYALQVCILRFSDLLYLHREEKLEEKSETRTRILK